MKVYIIDKYEKFMQQGNEMSIHWVSNQQYCVREVEMDWGTLVIQSSIYNPLEPDWFHVYETYEEAIQYIKKMQQINGSR